MEAVNPKKRQRRDGPPPRPRLILQMLGCYSPGTPERSDMVLFRNGEDAHTKGQISNCAWLLHVLWYAGASGAIHFRCCDRKTSQYRFYQAFANIAICSWQEVVLHNRLPFATHDVGVTSARSKCMQEALRQTLSRAVSRVNLEVGETPSWLHIGATRLRCSICKVRGYCTAKLSFYRYSREQDAVYVCSSCVLSTQPELPRQFFYELGLERLQRALERTEKKQ